MLVAHAGHWAVGILYTIPVFAVLIALRVSIVRERRREAAGGDAESADAATDAPAAGSDEPVAASDEPAR